MSEFKHGTVNGYNNRHCRCDDCRAAWATSVRESKAKRASRPIPEHVHGTANGYGNYRCRCEACTAAWSKDTVERAKRRGYGSYGKRKVDSDSGQTDS